VSGSLLGSAAVSSYPLLHYSSDATVTREANRVKLSSVFFPCASMSSLRVPSRRNSLTSISDSSSSPFCNNPHYLLTKAEIQLLLQDYSAVGDEGQLQPLTKQQLSELVRVWLIAVKERTAQLNKDYQMRSCSTPSSPSSPPPPPPSSSSSSSISALNSIHSFINSFLFSDNNLLLLSDRLFELLDLNKNGLLELSECERLLEGLDRVCGQQIRREIQHQLISSKIKQINSIGWTKTEISESTILPNHSEKRHQLSEGSWWDRLETSLLEAELALFYPHRSSTDSTSTTVETIRNRNQFWTSTSTSWYLYIAFILCHLFSVLYLLISRNCAVLRTVQVQRVLLWEISG